MTTDESSATASKPIPAAGNSDRAAGYDDVRNPQGTATKPTYSLTRSRCPVRAVQCRRDNKAEVDAFLRAFPTHRHYVPNNHGGWQGIHDWRGQVEHVWIDSWLVEIPETHAYKNMAESRLRDFYEVPDA